MDYQKTLEELIQYYQNLLIVQYYNSKDNRAMIKLLAELIHANNLIFQVRDKCLNVEESTGLQLDTVGEWVGLDRLYDNSILWNERYFALLDWNKKPNPNTQGGFSTYKDFSYLEGKTMTWKTLQDIKPVSYKMGDEYYRHLIKLKIIYNSIRFVKKEIDDAIWQWSNGKVYTTWQKMGVIYNYDIEYSQYVALALYKGILPAPSGCTIYTKLV